MRHMFIAILGFNLLLSPLVMAEVVQKETNSQMAGMINMLKFMAKAYVMSADLNKYKTKYVKQINELSDEEFKQNYALAYSYIKQSNYKMGFKQNMSKKQLIDAINSLTKEKLAKMIEEVDTKYIEHEIKKQLALNNKSGNKFDMKSITDTWNEIRKQLN